MPSQSGNSRDDPRGLFPLTIAALGVVYGDLATSPLYAINEIFFGFGKISVEPSHVIGAISLAIWALIIIVSLKYVGLVLLADNDGQGGVCALYGILQRHRNKGAWIFLSVLMLSAGMMFGIGIITPAISVLAAVEGLRIATPLFDSAVIPITCVLLLILFSIQRFGTARVGGIFGPIVLAWLTAIAWIGVRYLILEPQILYAFDPQRGIAFLGEVGLKQSLLVFGGVMLVITGGEALYADLGHFGKTPIRYGWFTFVFPALLLNYLGQGAFLLHGDPVKGGSIFYSMVPSECIYPIVILATAATIIASQALISGAFSLTLQAVGLGLFPRAHIVHTHEEHAGQIYIAFTNWALCIGCIVLVLALKTSHALASAYGLAVSADMLTTSLAMLVVARHVWQWPSPRRLLTFGAFAAIDALFLASNSVRFFEGGFIPLLVGVAMFIVMYAWSWGRKATFIAYHAEDTMKMRDIIELKRKSEPGIDRSAILMCLKATFNEDDNAPVLLHHYLDRFGVLPKNLILLDVRHKTIPYVRKDRYSIRKFYSDPVKGSISSVTVHFGFMEDPNVEGILEELARQKELALEVNPHEWCVHAAKERLVPAAGISWIQRQLLNLFIFLRQNSTKAYFYYGLGTSVKLSVEVFPVQVR